MTPYKCEKVGCPEIGERFMVLDTFQIRLCAQHHHDFDRWAISLPEYKQLREQRAQWCALVLAYRGGGDHAADVLKLAAGKGGDASMVFAHACNAWLDTPDREEAAE
jgi:hypothetical protein